MCVGINESLKGVRRRARLATPKGKAHVHKHVGPCSDFTVAMLRRYSKCDAFCYSTGSSIDGDGHSSGSPTSSGNYCG